MILEVGKTYTSQDLAEWFGIAKKSFTNTKTKKLEELGYHCDYEEKKKGFYSIKEVYYPVYDRKLNKIERKVKEVLSNYLQEIDTCINIGVKINRSVFNSKYSDKYIAVLVGRVMKEDPDKYAYSKTVGIKKGENGTATFRLFNEEEERLYLEALKDYLHDITDEKAEAMVKDVKDREAGVISDDDFRKKDYNLMSTFDFMGFRSRVQRRLNLTDEEYANRLRNFKGLAKEEEFKWE